jgi:hypothetical protein
MSLLGLSSATAQAASDQQASASDALLGKDFSVNQSKKII